MESIYDHSPTLDEIINITYGLPKDVYLARTSKELLIADIAILYADRGHEGKSQEYWDKVPALHEEFLLGFDNLIVVK